MFTKITRQPQAEDKQTPLPTQQQRLLNLVLAGLAIPGALFGLLMALLAALGRVPWAGAIAGLGVQPFYLLAYWLGRRGKVQLAAYIPVLAVIFAMLGGGLQIGIGHVTYIGYAMATLTAAILISNQAAVLIALLSTVVHIGTGLAQQSGALAAAISPTASVIPDGIGLGLGLVVLIAFTAIFNQEIRDSLSRERKIRGQLQSAQRNLENQIANRTRDLEHRILQIRTAAEISRTLSAVLDQDVLLADVVQTIQEAFNLYYVGVFLLDEQRRTAVLQAGTGEAGQLMVSQGHKLEVGGESMVGWATANRQARIALDVGSEPVRFENPLLPLTRSELALPIMTAEQVLGALSIQSDRPHAFDQDDITVLQAIADSLATALENARLFSQVQTNLLEIQTLHRQYLANAWGQIMQRNRDLQYTLERNVEIEPQTTIEVPLTLRDQVIGSLRLDTAQGYLSQDERIFVDAVATQAALALENARLLEETQRQAVREQKINLIATQLRSSNDLDSILRTTVRELGKALGAARTYIQLGVEPDGNGR